MLDALVLLIKCSVIVHAKVIEQVRKLTYMSIRERLCILLSEGKLIDRPSSFDELSGRKLYVTPEIDGNTRSPFADTPRDSRLAELAATFDAFCELGAFSVAEDPFRKPSDTMLARVHRIEYELWSMRITEPEETPGIRVFGGFVAKDEFAVVSWEFREDIGEFDEYIEAKVRAAWTDFFGCIPPHSGGDLDDYLTNYYRA